MRDVPPDAPAQAARRDLLRLLLLAPAAAACATAAPATRPSASDPGRPAPVVPEDPAAEALRAVREHPLPPGAEPALVFRALGPGGR